ncbi:MAG: RagB/SusD family nutrient uptake outer membrane protein [Nonlabens sp.]|uniref:RagB/SusD family nutrient uptake outer membrane protein n=1 Tax=Nonlabens sp. TaxID=1888209 RepID=UPI003EF721E8
MKKIYILLGLLVSTIACNSDLDQVPPNIAKSDSLSDYEGVLNAAYYYQLGGVTPMAIMGEFRADNAIMDEAPYTEFDEYDNNLTDMEDQFFGPFYTAMYKSILSANNVIANSTNSSDILEASFLRGMSYFKLVQVFGDVSVILTPQPSIEEISNVDLTRQTVADIYNNIIIPDLQNAMSSSNVGVAAEALLGKVYMYKGDYADAVPHLEAVIANGNYELQENFNEIFGADNESNSEIIYAAEIASSIVDEYSFASRFWNWYVGDDSKADEPVDPDLIAAFDASDANGGGTDLRRAVTLNEDGTTAIKFPKEGGNGSDHDWIEIRLADIILLYAEALNETGSPATTVLPLLDDIRSRAGLTSLTGTATTQAEVRQAILDERRLELAFEGHRWFDLVRTGSVNAEMGQTINSDYYLFPIPVSEVLASFGVIEQNPGY